MASTLALHYFSCCPLPSIPSPSLLSDWFVPPVSERPEFWGSVHHIEDVRLLLLTSAGTFWLCCGCAPKHHLLQPEFFLHPAASQLCLKHRDNAGVNGARGWFNWDRCWAAVGLSVEATGLPFPGCASSLGTAPLLLPVRCKIHVFRDSVTHHEQFIVSCKYKFRAVPKSAK